MIYPHSYAQFLKAGRTKEELMDILQVVHLAYLPEQEGGWATVKEWRDLLSEGEKQRVCRISALSSGWWARRGRVVQVSVGGGR